MVGLLRHARAASGPRGAAPGALGLQGRASGQPRPRRLPRALTPTWWRPRQRRNWALGRKVPSELRRLGRGLSHGPAPSGLHGNIWARELWWQEANGHVLRLWLWQRPHLRNDDLQILLEVLGQVVVEPAPAPPHGIRARETHGAHEEDTRGHAHTSHRACAIGGAVRALRGVHGRRVHGGRHGHPPHVQRERSVELPEGDDRDVPAAQHGLVEEPPLLAPRLCQGLRGDLQLLTGETARGGQCIMHLETPPRLRHRRGLQPTRSCCRAAGHCEVGCIADWQLCGVHGRHRYLGDGERRGQGRAEVSLRQVAAMCVDPDLKDAPHI
mmetsp:Transcript_58258/g.170349  ORF Transcript_58258/g.170349 Transcript_58258/m.170349 type:complete len:326 (+) Transcript_58258:517-1494(+)